MIVGQHIREDDLEVNVARKKQLTNIRSSSSEEAMRIDTPRVMSLDDCLEYIAEDELVEITPKNLPPTQEDAQHRRAPPSPQVQQIIRDGRHEGRGFLTHALGRFNAREHTRPSQRYTAASPTCQHYQRLEPLPGFGTSAPPVVDAANAPKAASCRDGKARIARACGQRHSRGATRYARHAAPIANCVSMPRHAMIPAPATAATPAPTHDAAHHNTVCHHGVRQHERTVRLRDRQRPPAPTADSC